ncbi:MAG: hypothetical protein KDE48_23005 [Anaerolineales bacterium]|nr:hypothetical protein [Anaerolineales bacterium]
MSFQEKNISVTLVSFSIILTFFVYRVLQMVQTDSFTSQNIFRLWGIVIVFAIIVTVVGMILTHIVSAIVIVIQTGDDNPEIEDIEDERDKLIDLKGTKITYSITSIGSFFAMLTFALGQSPLIMFTLLIFFGLVAQVIGDITRLTLYRRGF